LPHPCRLEKGGISEVTTTTIRRNKMERIKTPNAKHLYDVEVQLGEDYRTRKIIEVEANNRDQAARLAKKAGYEPCSVNMIG
jgi:hypothetical protein